MSTIDSGALESSATDPRIEGPIPETNKHGRYTGHGYYVCTQCGAEAMRPKDIHSPGGDCQ